jgi:hypothetical protein
MNFHAHGQLHRAPSRREEFSWSVLMPALA